MIVQEKDALLHAIHSHFIVSVTDGAGRIIDVNERFCGISGYTRAELLGQSHRLVASGVHEPAFWAGLWRAMGRGESWHGEICNRAKDGSVHWLETVIAPFIGGDGRVEKCVSIRTDITAAKRGVTAVNSATQANAAKSVFLANMSHEIRTPLNIVIGLAYLLRQTRMSGEQAGFVAQINEASKLLLTVITDVLDLSKIEAGELLIACAAFSPAQLLESLRSLFSAQAEARGISLEFDLPADLPAALLGDATRLNQILANLISNAIKFTERGGVRVIVRPIGASATGVTLRFTVEDTGIGIEPAALARLFTPFVQVDESITRRYGGTGLGLTIVHRLTQLLGGEVAVSSTPGVGSEFRVELEFAYAAPELLIAAVPAPPARRGPGLAGVRLLVVDDNDVNLQVTRLILEQNGAEVQLACNGQQAVDLIGAGPGDFDVVLMDVQMPVLDGYEATRRVRTDLGLAQLPIIALTAGALSSERVRAAAVGMNDFIIKPFDAVTLVNIVRRYAERGRAAVEALAPVPAPAASGSQQAPAAPTAPVAPAAQAWPDIEDIDGAEARSRWCEDLNLFRPMLEHFLGEFADIAATASCHSPDGMAALAARLHKLKGGACMLGAKAVEQMAAETEAACRANDAPLAGQLATRLAARLERLRASVAAAFAGTRVEMPQSVLADEVELDPAALAALILLLRQMRMSARDCFIALAPSLQGLLGAASFLRVRTQIDNLEFDEAADALEAAAATRNTQTGP
jgi:PAS domain S-box-containing protein